jgi:hypothetical protein
VNAEVAVFPVVVGLLTNRRLRLQFERTPDDGHDGARNMLSGVYVTKQMLRLTVASGWVFYLNIINCHSLGFTEIHALKQYIFAPQLNAFRSVLLN